MKIKLKLQNKLLLIICCLFIIVFLAQFLFQNLFFNTYYKNHQTKLLDSTIDRFYSSIEQKSLTKEKQNELTNNNKILIAYVDKQANPIAGNMYSDETIIIKTRNNKTHPNDDPSSDDNQGSGTTEKSGDNPYEGDVVKYARFNNVNIAQHMTIMDYLSNLANIKPGTKVYGSKEKYLVTTRSLPTGYVVASISMAQSEEIINILNSFNIYIILITLVLVALLVMQFAHRIVNPIFKMQKGAQAIARQDFNHKVYIKTGDELEELAEALNNISDNLEEKINTLQTYNVKLKQEYEERLEIEKNQKNLLINISHDLKTPLTVIKGYLKAIKDGVYNRNKYIDTAINSVDDINNILSEMIELTKYSSKAYHLSLQEVDLTRLIYRTYNGVFYLSKEKNQHVVLHILDDVFIRADENAIKKVLDNIIINAINYSPIGANITLQLIKNGNTCELSIENEGVYIQKNDLKHIFEAFYRADKSRKETVQGNGLGLSIVKIILDHHNYYYNISNTEKGVKFSIIMDYIY